VRSALMLGQRGGGTPRRKVPADVRKGHPHCEIIHRYIYLHRGSGKPPVKALVRTLGLGGMHCIRLEQVSVQFCG